MVFFKDMTLNLILVMFPVLVYFIYNCYRELKCEEYNALLFNLSLFSSVYLCVKYGNIENNTLGLLFCNLPIIVAYLKEQPKVAGVLSVMIIGYSWCMIGNLIWVLIIKYVCYFVIYLVGKGRRVRDNNFILAIVVLQGFFLSFEYFYGYVGNGFVTLLELVLVMMLFYLFPFLLLYLFNLGDKITSLHLTVKEMGREKQIRDSLFKITHEVKNPIAVCKGYLDMLDISDEDKVRRYIPIIRNEIVRSLDIMNDFMEFSKIKIEKDIIDINMLMEEIGDEFLILVDSKNIDLRCNLVDDEIYVEGDYNRLKQVFVNMIKNSLEAMDGEGRLEISSYVDNGYYYAVIEDNGSGMDDETLKRVKEMFFTTKRQGSGLGVSLSNEIIEAHGGSMEYSSTLGCGTKVVVRVPIVVL